MEKITRRDFIKLSAITTGVLCAGTYSFKMESQAGYYPPFKMCFLTDPHLSYKKDSEGWIMLNESLVILQDVVRQINEIGPDFTIIGGDLTDNADGALNELDGFTDIVQGLNHPCFVVLGDREAFLAEDLTKAHVIRYFRRNSFTEGENTYWSHDVQGIHLIGLDSTVLTSNRGRLDLQQLGWLEQDLAINQDKLTVISLHHSPISLCPEDQLNTWSHFVLENGSTLCSLIRRYSNVKLVLSGHHHANRIQEDNGTLYVSSASIATYPNQFKVITLKNGVLQIDSMNIKYKQIIEKSKKQLVLTKYASEYNKKGPKKVLQFQLGSNTDRSIELKL